MAMPMIDDQSLDHVFYPDSDDQPMAENMLLAVFDAGNERRWLFPLDEALRAEAERERADAAAARIAELEARLAALAAGAAERPTPS